MESLHLAIAIADRENTEKVIETFREGNVFTTDIVLGTGTAPTEILDYLYLSPNEKAVVFGVVTNAGLLPLLKNFKRRLFIDVPGNGIVATVPLNSIGGRRSLEYILDGQTLDTAGKRIRTIEEREGKMSVKTDFELIIVIGAIIYGTIRVQHSGILNLIYANPILRVLYILGFVLTVINFINSYRSQKGYESFISCLGEHIFLEAFALLLALTIASTGVMIADSMNKDHGYMDTIKTWYVYDNNK